MDYVIKKTNLGLAIDETIVELGLERMAREVSHCFREAFLKHYEELASNSLQMSISGIEEKMKESPIGLDNQSSCYTLIASGIKYGGPV